MSRDLGRVTSQCTPVTFRVSTLSMDIKTAKRSKKVNFRASFGWFIFYNGHSLKFCKIFKKIRIHKNSLLQIIQHSNFLCQLIGKHVRFHIQSKFSINLKNFFLINQLFQKILAFCTFVFPLENQHRNFSKKKRKIQKPSLHIMPNQSHTIPNSPLSKPHQLRSSLGTQRYLVILFDIC